jgi:hypothetical protein
VPQQPAPSSSAWRDSTTSRVPKGDSITETAIAFIARDGALPA